MIRVAMTLELSSQRNDAIAYFTCSGLSRHLELFFQNHSQELFLHYRPWSSWSLSEICVSVIDIFWHEVFMVRNTIKNGQYWCLAVICRKQSASNMQFHLIVVSIFLKTCVKNHGDSSSQLLERRVWLVRIKALLLGCCKLFSLL